MPTTWSSALSASSTILLWSWACTSCCLQEVKKVDDYTVQLVTKIPYPVFAGSLVHIMMLDKETCEGLTSEEISANPVGTGRYRLVEHVKESYIKLVRNDEYWGELPDAETVEFRVIANAATRTTALINGEVDFISNIPVMDVDRLKDASNVQVITNPSLSCSYPWALICSMSMALPAPTIPTRFST